MGEEEALLMEDADTIKLLITHSHAAVGRQPHTSPACFGVVGSDRVVVVVVVGASGG